MTGSCEGCVKDIKTGLASDQSRRSRGRGRGERKGAAAGYWRLYQQTVQSTTIMTGDWRLCRALLLLLVTRLYTVVLLLLVTGDCAEYYRLPRILLVTGCGG